uniref:Immunoglobulin V-set domain-containing protein n=1 Tax=Mastacembelus armatus TaxID=205130 RepID=A0A7N8XCI9_9TELE
ADTSSFWQKISPLQCFLLLLLCNYNISYMWLHDKKNNITDIATDSKGTQSKVSCSYPEGYETYMKYLCRDPCDDADVLIESTATQKNRYSISDDNGKRVFTTTISDLSKTDAGKYWCGVSRTGQDIYTELDVKGDAGTYWCGSDPQWTVGNYTKIELSVGETTAAYHNKIHV